MKPTATRLASMLLALAILLPAVSAIAAQPPQPPPPPGVVVVQNQIYALFYQTSAVAAASGFTQGQRTSLAAKLIHAADAIGRGNNDAALNDLGAFYNEVNALEQSGRLSPADAATLSGQASSIAAQIAALQPA